MIDYAMLITGWVLWCFIHSLLITETVSAYLKRRLGRFQYHYRLLFNLTALLTLLPMMVLTALMSGTRVFGWQGWWIVLRLLMVGTALWLFKDGAKQYDGGYMLGLSQIQDKRHHPDLMKVGQFSRRGANGLVRHPWYLGVILFLWSFLPVYSMGSIVAATVLSAYVIVGTLLEERKLIQLYGDSYRRYQSDVPMLIPWKFLFRKSARK